MGMTMSAILGGILLRGLLGAQSERGRGTLAIASVSVFAWATLARLGWAGQSYSGDTAVERIDDTWFRTLYWIGMLLATLSVF